MRGFHWENFAALTRQFSPDQRRAASIAAVTHALHDGYTDLIYIMLPLWQAEFGLDYAALGLLRGVFVGAMASLQIPAGLASEKLGAALVLGARHGARRPRLLPGRRELRLRHAARRVVHRRARRQHPASDRLRIGRPRFCRAALAHRARHLQFRRRYRQDDSAGHAVADVAGDGVAPGAGHSRLSRLRAGRGDLRRHAALRCATARPHRSPR